MAINLAKTSIEEVTVEISEADLAVVQATYALWDARFALARLTPADMMSSDLVAIQRDIDQVSEQLMRLTGR